MAVTEFSLEELTELKLHLIGMLVRAMDEADKASIAIGREGTVLTTSRGPMRNPRVGIFSTYLASVIQLRKTLGMNDLGHSLAAESRKRTLTKKIENATLSVVEADDGANLLKFN